MKKEFYYLISILCSVVFVFTNVKVYATSQDVPPTFEETFTNVGFKSIEESVQEFEEFCNCEVKLPKVLPSISFTHEFGRFWEDEEYINDSLEIRYVNENKIENHFKIDIQPLENKMVFKGKKYLLEDGAEAVYFESDYFNFMVFERNNLQYIMGITKKISNKETPNELVQIANSIK